MRYTTIKGAFSENRRMPRGGRIRLGLKVQYGVGKNGEPLVRPKEVDYFVVPEEVEKIVGKEPKELTIMLPSDRKEDIFPQNLAWFGSSRGLKCEGNGEEALRLNPETEEWEKRTCPCEHYKSKENPKGECTEQGNLLFFIPSVSMGWTYQLRTGSYHSVVDINSGLDLIRGLIGRIAMVPLKLRRVARDTHNEGKKQVHYTCSLTLDANIAGINALRADNQRILETARLQIEGPSAINATNDGLPPDETIAEDAEAPEGEEDTIQDVTPEARNAAALENGRAKLRAQQEKPQPEKPAAPIRTTVPPSAVSFKPVTDQELKVPIGHLVIDPEGQDVLGRILKNFQISDQSVFPTDPETRATYLEELWAGVGEAHRQRSHREMAKPAR